MAGLPNITGKTYNLCSASDYEEGALSNGIVYTDSGYAGSTSTKNRLRDIILDASRSNPIYGKSTTVTPTSQSTLYVMKY